MRLKLFILLTLATIFAVACNQPTATNQSANAPDKTVKNSSAKKKIGVTLLTREDDFYRELEAGLKETAEQNGFELLVQSGDKDLSKQQSQIDNFIVQKVDAIIVCPTDTKGIAPAVERANAANIPVFTADIAAGGGKIVSHVASNNTEGGKLAAEFVAAALAGKNAKVGIIGQPEVQSVIDRETGFKDEISKHANLQVVPTINGEGKRDRALKAAEDLLQGNPDIKAIFCINDETALGALSAVEAKGKKDVIIVGYDAAPEAVEKILKDTALKATVQQLPRDIGAKTVEAVAKHFKGEQVPPKTDVKVQLIQASGK